MASVGGRRFVDRVFLTRRGEPKLVKCAVLFIDILGVREMNRSRRVVQHLKALDHAVSRMYRDFLKADSPWPAAFFSDTLVLASPVLQAGDEESSIGGLAIQSAWLQLNLIAQGFFVRGALSFGRFHIRDGLVFGPALVEAYRLESEIAVHPRVVLSQEAERSQRRDLRHYARQQNSPQSTLLLSDADGWTFINYLGLLFDEPDDNDLRAGLELHRDKVTARLSEHRTIKRHWEKYRWVAEYHNAVVSKRLPNAVDLLVNTEDITWQFDTFA